MKIHVYPCLFIPPPPHPSLLPFTFPSALPSSFSNLILFLHIPSRNSPHQDPSCATPIQTIVWLNINRIHWCIQSGESGAEEGSSICKHRGRLLERLSIFRYVMSNHSSFGSYSLFLLLDPFAPASPIGVGMHWIFKNLIHIFSSWCRSMHFRSTLVKDVFGRS